MSTESKFEAAKSKPAHRPSLQAPRGMYDTFGLEQRKRRFIEETCRRVAAVYGYEEITTPIAEEESLFSRTLGSESDVVSKEMYTFPDRSGNTLSLRPEGTAGVVRAAINHGRDLGNKLFYQGPMFRYERPQKGRARQFHQFGIEHMNTSHPMCDVHVIEMASTILEQLQIADYSLHINSLGDDISRSNYRNVLETYLNKHKGSLSPLSRTRLERGSVLRVLDSKEIEDELVVRDAPTLQEHLTPESSRRFSQVISGLDALGLKYIINPRLVRGLDYYNDTCFEFVTNSGNSASGQAIIAGGRYDKLSEIMGGQPKPGVGWASGIERLSLLLSESMLPKKARPIAIIPVSESNDVVDDDMWIFSMQLAHSLRATGVPALLSYENTPAKHTKKAAKENCRYCVYVGSDELKKGTVVVKDMDTSKQFECSIDQIRALFPMYTKE